MPFWSRKKERDPVCGMEVDPGKAAATHDYQGKLYYFCSPSCKESFAKDPGKYLKGPSGAAGGMSGHH